MENLLSWLMPLFSASAIIIAPVLAFIILYFIIKDLTQDWDDEDY